MKVMPRPLVTPYKRLLMQMLAVLLCLGLIPLIAVGIVGFLSIREATETRLLNVLEAMVKNRKVTVELFLEEKMRQLAFVAATHSAEQLSDNEKLESLLEQMRQNSGAIIDLGLISENGIHLAYAGPYKLQNVDYSDQLWFQQVMVLGRYESDVFPGLRHLPHMVMAVKKREKGRDWILRATIDTDILSSLVREGGLESGADVFILNRAGEYQTSYSNEHLLMEKADIDSVPMHSGVRVTKVDRNGKIEFLATSWLSGDSWILVARQSAPGFSSFLQGQSTVMWLLAVWFIAVPSLSYMIARFRLRQFRALESERAALYESTAQSQKMAAIGRLAAGIAHEINNPLAIIQAQTGVLSDLVAENPDHPGTAEFRNRVTKIEAQVERARKVTHRLLAFSRRVGPELEPVDVVAALEETVGFVERDLEASQIRIMRNYSQSIPIIRSNLAQMQQVFLNLINNALDAIGKGGQVNLSAQNSDNGVIVKVADSGPGIPPKDLAKIFEPFYSTKNSSERNTGLGLAICREIMQNLNGRIEVESKPGEGTIFSLWFPLEAEE
jgi:two-component system NtrC family sensor kinase